jgi:hypothetical protein
LKAGFSNGSPSALDLSTASKDDGSVEGGALAGACGLAVAAHTDVNRPDKCLFGGGVINSDRYRLAVLYEADGNAELGETLNKHTRAIERIHDPNALLVEAVRSARRFF